MNKNGCIILTNNPFLCSIYGDGYPCFEISAINADKPPLTVSQIKDRVKQFEKVGEADSIHLLYYTHLPYSLVYL